MLQINTNKQSVLILCFFRVIYVLFFIDNKINENNYGVNHEIFYQ
jgi:hypothetical protein